VGRRIPQGNELVAGRLRQPDHARPRCEDRIGDEFGLAGVVGLVFLIVAGGVVVGHCGEAIRTTQPRAATTTGNRRRGIRVRDLTTAPREAAATASSTGRACAGRSF
jgi:hypothetical protein